MSNVSEGARVFAAVHDKIKKFAGIEQNHLAQNMVNWRSLTESKPVLSLLASLQINVWMLSKASPLLRGRYPVSQQTNILRSKTDQTRRK